LRAYCCDSPCSPGVRKSDATKELPIFTPPGGPYRAREHPQPHIDKLCRQTPVKPWIDIENNLTKRPRLYRPRNLQWQ